MVAPVEIETERIDPAKPIVLYDYEWENAEPCSFTKLEKLNLENEEHVAQLLDLYKHPETYQHFAAPPKNLKDLERRQKLGYLTFIALDGEEVVAAMNIVPVVDSQSVGDVVDEETNININHQARYLGADFHGSNFMEGVVRPERQGSKIWHDMCKLVLTHCFEELGLVKVESAVMVVPEWQRSMKAQLNEGFKPRGFNPFQVVPSWWKEEHPEGYGPEDIKHVILLGIFPQDYDPESYPVSDRDIAEVLEGYYRLFSPAFPKEYYPTVSEVFEEIMSMQHRLEAE